MEEILRRLEQLREYASGLQNLATEAAEAAPGHSEGADRTGMIRVIVGRDGLPESIRVAAQWQQKLEPGSFAAAVMAAFQAAAKQRAAAWSAVLADSGWQERLDRLADETSAAGTPKTSSVPAAFRRGLGNGRPPRPLEMLAEDVIGVLDEAARSAAAASGTPPRTARGTGSNRIRTLTITLSRTALAACEADPAWVARQTGPRLVEALAAALTAAREDLARVVPAGAGGAADPAVAAGSHRDAGQHLDGVLAEIFATLNDPQQ